MPLFRFHRRELIESLQTTIIVKTFNEMMKAIIDSFDEEMIKKQNWEIKFEIERCPSIGSNFDPRIGWYTHIVLANILSEHKMHPVGFLSEPF